MDPYIPFCGAPPVPAELWSRWTLDPWLLAGLALMLAMGLRHATHRRRFTAGWALTALLFVSPLCAASMALFSARVGQHLLLTLAAAPLLAGALPLPRWPVLPLAGLFAVAFWGWHAPGPYGATLDGDLAYWAMHLSLFGAATVLFGAILHAPHRAVPAAVLTAAQVTALAVTLVLSPAAWHDWHLATAPGFGLTALADQQLAGALMWVAGGGLWAALIAWAAARVLAPGTAGTGRRGAG